MQLPEIDLLFDLDEPDNQSALKERFARKLGVLSTDLPELEIKRKAIDARHNKVRFLLTIGPLESDSIVPENLPQTKGEPVLIVGAGPAGIFCAYQLARLGIRSIIFERGKDVRQRRPDLKALNQHHTVNPESNYCFGEGGAGTYSDGKLYTRSHKRGNVRDILEILYTHGAPSDILVNARPHIGSNKLPKVVTALREHLESVGVQFRFESRVDAFLVEGGKAVGVRLKTGEEVLGKAVVVAAGHSARDTLLAQKKAGATLEAKDFALGVRIEHPQPLIDAIQYGKYAGHDKLRAAPYKLAHTPKDGRGVFSFCMCPGGFIVPASTDQEGLVVNGMSLSRRNSPYANSGFVVSIRAQDNLDLKLDPIFGGIEIQRRIERAAKQAGGNTLAAPAQRVTDFLAGKLSQSLPSTSYQPGLTSAPIAEVLDSSGLLLSPHFRTALHVFNEKMPGYITREAVLVGVESRTSCPVRVVRDPTTLMAQGVGSLYPCAEGAGYAGGIVSAALDGMRVAVAIANS